MAIEYLDAERVRQQVESSVLCIATGETSPAPLVQQAYDRGAPIMLEGEPGSGKTELAGMLYLEGRYADQPFIRIPCDTLNDRAWTHLLKSHDSPLYRNGATLAFDALHALSARRSRELLAVLADSAATERCHAIFAGNDVPGGGECDAVALIAERLSCAVCVTTPLRNRDDIGSLVERYLAYLAEAFGATASELEDGAVELLQAYAWPRNFLQLREVCERAFILAGGETVSEEIAREVLAQESVIRSVAFSTPRLDTDLFVLRPLAEIERDIARMVVDYLGGNKTRAAEVLGISRTTLWRLLKGDERKGE